MNSANTTLSTLKTLLTQTTKTLSTLQIPIQSQSQIQFPHTKNQFIQTTNKFFYQNYPSPVTLTSPPPPIFTLPTTLSRECLETESETININFPINSFTFLPSDIWLIINEIETNINNINNNNNNNDNEEENRFMFSIRVLRVFIRLYECDLSRVSEYVITRSVYYGIVIDLEVRDCLILLVKLCLKAIVREAVRVLSSVSVSVEKGKYECLVFKEVVSWLGERFGVLYGGNGRSFANEVVKECVVESALSGSLFGVVEGGETSGSTVGGTVISVEGVEKAVIGLYERFLVEERIRAARDQRQLSAYQRNMEHSYITKVAEEERQKRPDYKPIIDHDSLLWNLSRNQDTNRTKTREELLAEERDYKRRRMSYRGKKSKGSAVEVMRDIIEVYMDEIKQSGIMGSTSEPVEGTGVENKHLDVYKNNQSSSHDYHDLEDFNENVTVKHEGDRIDYLEKRDGRSGSHSKEPHHRERRDRSKSKSHEESYHATERHEREYNNRKRERYEDDKEYRESGGRRTMRDNKGRNEDYSTDKDRQRRKTNRSSRSRPERHNEFEDRYDPTDSREKRRKTNRSSSSRPERPNEFEDRYDPTDSREERRKTNRSSSSRPERHNEFEDRYDPTDSRGERKKTNRTSSSRPERYNEFEDRYDPTDWREES